MNPVQMDITSIVRVPNKNAFVMRVSVWPPLYVFKTSNIQPAFRMLDPTMTITKAVFDNQSNEFVFEVDFQQHCWDRLLTIEFVPDVSIDARYFASVSSSASLKTKLYFFSDFTLASIQFLPYLCYLIMAVGICGAVLGFLARRLGGLEALIACQVSLMSVIWMNADLLDPFSSAQPLHYVLGFRKAIFAEVANSSRLLASVTNNPDYPSSPFLSQFGYSSASLANNFNVMFFLQSVPFLGYLIVSIVLRFYSQRLVELKKLQDEYEARPVTLKYNNTVAVKEWILQALMYIGMLNLVPFIIGVLAYFKVNAHPQYDIASLGIIAGAGVLYVLTFVIFYFDSDPFDYFRYSFRLEVVAMHYYFIYTPVIISTCVLLVITPLTWPPLIPVSCLLCFTALYRPYRETR